MEDRVEEIICNIIWKYKELENMKEMLKDVENNMKLLIFFLVWFGFINFFLYMKII